MLSLLLDAGAVALLVAPILLLELWWFVHGRRQALLDPGDYPEVRRLPELRLQGQRHGHAAQPGIQHEGQPRRQGAYELVGQEVRV